MQDAERPADHKVLLHLGLVVLVTIPYCGILLVARSGSSAFPIGLGLLALPLVPLGLPWSLPYEVNPYAFDDVGEPLYSLLQLGPAYLNVLLHALWRRFRRRRRSTADHFK